MKTKEICSSCGRPRVIQNKEYNLCRECNSKRLECEGVNGMYAGKNIAEINHARRENEAGDITLHGSHVRSGEDGSIEIVNEIEETEPVPLNPTEIEPADNSWTQSDFDSLGSKIATLLFNAQPITQKKNKVFKCPDCQADLSPLQRFCSVCGSEMEWEK